MKCKAVSFLIVFCGLLAASQVLHAQASSKDRVTPSWSNLRRLTTNAASDIYPFRPTARALFFSPTATVIGTFIS